MVIMSGSGTVNTNPYSIARKENWDANLGDFKSLLVDIHLLTLIQVSVWSGWFMGDQAQGLSISTDMNIKALDHNLNGNQGLVILHKIHLQRLSGALHFIAKNHLKHSSYNFFYPWKEFLSTLTK